MVGSPLIYHWFIVPKLKELSHFFIDPAGPFRRSYYSFFFFILYASLFSFPNTLKTAVILNVIFASLMFCAKRFLGLNTTILERLNLMIAEKDCK